MATANAQGVNILKRFEDEVRKVEKQVPVKQIERPKPVKTERRSRPPQKLFAGFVDSKFTD